MNTRQIFGTAVLSTLLTLMILSGAFLFFDRAQAAQTVVNSLDYGSVSAMAFVPVQQNATFFKDTQRGLLTLTGPSRVFTTDRNVFVAPLDLPDKSQIQALTLFGEDYDPQGEVRVRLKRCDHGQARCLNLAETTSTGSFSGGPFETTRTVIQQQEFVNNGFYTYFLELELTVLSNSGLRSVRLELVTGGAAAPPVEQTWSLSGSVTSFPIPNFSVAQARICTDDLSTLPNSTHYPFVVVDGNSVPLSSNSCVTVWGRDIEVRRRPNTGPSSGTYQIVN
jgi:hypothetical protein